MIVTTTTIVLQLYWLSPCRYSPSSFTNVLTVGGTRRTDELYNTFIYGSNYGSCVNIFAPAQRVQSAYYTGPNSYATLDGTSQATPLVSGAAAVYWNTLSGNAVASQVKNILLSTCSKGQLNIAASVPSPFNQQTTNCLLYIQNAPSPSQKIYHKVNIDEAETLIKEMEQQNYALSYSQNYLTSANTSQYSFIFTQMKNKKFRTLVFVTERDLKETEDKLSPKGFKIIFIHDLNTVNNLKRFVVVLAKRKYDFTAKLRVKPESIQQVQDRAGEGMTLYSTSVVSNAEQNNILQTLLFSNQTTVHAVFKYNIKKTGLLTKIDDQMKQGYHLKYLSSYIINGKERYAVVSHKFTKSDEEYGVMYNVKSNKVEKKVGELITQGKTINVVTGIWQPKSDEVRYLIAYEST